MKKNKSAFRKMIFLALGLAGLAPSSQAATFAYRTADLALGFRQTGSYEGNYEVVVDIGQASNYVDLTIGTTITVPNFSSSQLSGCFSSFNNLSWSVTGYYIGSTYPGYPAQTLWLSQPRSSTNVQSTPPTRLDTGTQQTIHPEIQGIFLGATAISTAQGVSNQFNTPYFEQESVSLYPNDILSYYVGNNPDNPPPYIANLNDTWPEANLEITTSNSFTGSVRSDLYEVWPLTDASGAPINDPHVGTNGPAYFVGYFQLNSDGSMSFTRAASSSAPAEPPVPTLSIVRSGTTSTISFASTNGATYTLYFTNSAGLKSPVSTWPSSSTTITGDGTTKHFTDTATNANRFYRVSGN